MSAIGAIFQRNGAPVGEEDIARMAGGLALHGPLEQRYRRLGALAGCWTKGTEFTPEDSFDEQPIVAGETAFLFTGRLDYRADLARALGLASEEARAMPDSAMAHAAWQRWGRDGLLRLEGNWAFVVLDAARQELFAAKAALQGPPLVYHESAQLFAIASAPRGLFALPAIPREVDEQRVADVMILNYEDSARTFFKGVRHLRAGHWLEVTREGLRTESYYSFDDLKPVRFARDDEYVEALDALMRDAVEAGMRARVTPATTVSAGLDSSTVSVYALEALGRGVHGFTAPLLGFTHVPGKDWDGRTYGAGRLGDESGPVRALARMYPQFDVTFVDGEGLPIDHGLDDMIRYSEMPPFGWNNLHWGQEIARRTREAGRSVLLGGASGNRTISFTARNVFPKLFKELRWGEMHRGLRQLDWQQGMLKRYYRAVFSPLMPAGVNKAIARLRGDLSHAGYTGFSAINPAYASDMQVAERAREMDWDDSYTTIASPQELRRQMTFNGNREQNALAMLAGQSMNKVDHRDPLGCRRITEFCAAIPDEQYLNEGTDRWLARRLMKDRLPPEIVDLKVRGRQSADWHARFTKDIDRYRDEIERAAEDPEMAHRFDIPRLRRLFDTWPERTPLTANDHPDYLIAMVGLGRVIGMSRYINWANGKNQ
ncbi:asparagine synthetase B family protein [Aurantiacibacter luteus]|nr:asparagine synthetase B family protein [Aurantiacibacter luteus]